MSEHELPRVEIRELAKLAVHHGFHSIEDLEPGALIPFVVTEGASRGIQRFVADAAIDSVAQARRYVAHLSPDVTHYAIVYEAEMTVDEVRTDAIVAEVGERGANTASIFFLRYVVADSGMETQGVPSYGGESPVDHHAHAGPPITAREDALSRAASPANERMQKMGLSGLAFALALVFLLVPTPDEPLLSMIWGWPGALGAVLIGAALFPRG